MKAVIIHSGKYGSTKQYALWLGHELGVPVRSANIINYEQLDPYDTLLIGTSVYIGKLQIRKWMKENLEYIRNKKIILFQVAGSPPEDKVKRHVYNVASIPAEIIGNCEFFYLPGRLIMNKLSWKDRFMLKMGARLAKDPSDKKIMLTDYDHVKKENLAELVLEIKKKAEEDMQSARENGILSLIGVH
jgi:menaquinone-dependent protoporphyrinogen IX oxidase